jgi:hypothetical protein
MDTELRLRQWHERHAVWGCPATADFSCNPCRWPGSAEWARRNGWGPGTVLEGDEYAQHARITLVFVGAETVVARWPDGREHPTDLGSRNWRVSTAVIQKR